MNNYIIKKDFVDLKKIYEENNIELFEKRISTYSPKELFEFAAYFSLNISSKDEYYNVLNSHPEWQGKMDELEIEYKEREQKGKLVKKSLEDLEAMDDE